MDKSFDHLITSDVLRAHLGSAQVPALVMLTAHITGDLSVLRDEWRPSLPALPRSGLSSDVEAVVRARCLDLLEPHLIDQQNWPSAPEEHVRRAICTWLMGREVEDAQTLTNVVYTPNDSDPRMPAWNLEDIAPESGLTAVVIGSGFSGLLAGLRLKQAGVPFTILEKNSAVGGTWWENSYPDCRTDVRSHIYTYSFTQHDWTTHYGRQHAIQNYLHNFAVDNGLLEHTRFNTEVKAIRWDETSSTWTIETSNAEGEGETTRARIVVSAVGQLNRPLIPDTEGMESFAGPVVHTAQWDHSIDFTGKRVVVIGTGASAVQLTPALAKVAEHITISQRSAPWLRSSPDLRQEIDPDERWLLLHLNQYRAYYRYSIALPRIVGNLAAATVDPDFPPTELSVSAANEQLRVDLTAYLTDQAGNRLDLLDQIIPDYPPLAKRIILDDGTWVSTLKRDNVRLVRGSVQRIDRDGVWIGDEHVPADVIVLGTGFRASEFLLPMTVSGVGGQDLHETWGIDATAYMGITLPGFPNFFCMYGPNTNTVIHGNLVFYLECQAAYVLSAAQLLAKGAHTSMTLRPEVFANYDQEINEAGAMRAWSWSKTHSWYHNAAGRSTIMWPLPAVDYFERTSEVRAEDYTFG